MLTNEIKHSMLASPILQYYKANTISQLQANMETIAEQNNLMLINSR